MMKFSNSNSMKPGKVLVHINNYNFTKFHWIQMKNKKVFYDTLRAGELGPKLPLLLWMDSHQLNFVKTT